MRELDPRSFSKRNLLSFPDPILTRQIRQRGRFPQRAAANDTPHREADYFRSCALCAPCFSRYGQSPLPVAYGSLNGDPAAQSHSQLEPELLQYVIWLARGPLLAWHEVDSDPALFERAGQPRAVATLAYRSRCFGPHGFQKAPCQLCDQRLLKALGFIYCVRVMCHFTTCLAPLFAGLHERAESWMLYRRFRCASAFPALPGRSQAPQPAHCHGPAQQGK